jgi:amino acid transporter
MESERIPKWKALPIFSSDALSSVGYGPEQIALVLASIPALGLYAYFGRVVIAIILLLGIVALSYSQIIKANPGGGGSYVIAKKYLGEYPALITGAALFSDYLLTVAVSISSGTAAITSAFPFLVPYHLELDLFVLFLMMVINLRGVQEASTTFVWPTYIFIGCMWVTICGGLYQIFVLGVPAHALTAQQPGL